MNENHEDLESVINSCYKDALEEYNKLLPLAELSHALKITPLKFRNQYAKEIITINKNVSNEKLFLDGIKENAKQFGNGEAPHQIFSVASANFTTENKDNKTDDIDAKNTFIRNKFLVQIFILFETFKNHQTLWGNLFSKAISKWIQSLAVIIDSPLSLTPSHNLENFLCHLKKKYKIFEYPTLLD